MLFISTYFWWFMAGFTTTVVHVTMFDSGKNDGPLTRFVRTEISMQHWLHNTCVILCDVRSTYITCLFLKIILYLHNKVLLCHTVQMYLSFYWHRLYIGIYSL